MPVLMACHQRKDCSSGYNSSVSFTNGGDWSVLTAVAQWTSWLMWHVWWQVSDFKAAEFFSKPRPASERSRAEPRGRKESAERWKTNTALHSFQSSNPCVCPALPLCVPSLPHPILTWRKARRKNKQRSLSQQAVNHRRQKVRDS